MNKLKHSLSDKKISKLSSKDLLSNKITYDALGFWSEFHLECPWRSNKTNNRSVYCIAIVWQSGQTRPCTIETCAPYHFVKSFAIAVDRKSANNT